MRAHVVAISLAAAALVAWDVSRAWSAQKCLDGKQTCRSPVICSIKNHIMAKSAMQAVFADREARRTAQAEAERENPRGQYESPAAYEQRMRPFACKKLDDLAGRGMGKVFDQLPPCPGSTVGTAPGFSTNDSCVIKASHLGNDISDEQANAMNTCEEILDASRVHELYHQSRCKQTHRDGGARSLMTLDQCADEEVKSYHIEMAFLFDELDYRKLKCTPNRAHLKALRDTARRAARTLVAQGGRR